jgi:hypothetical protein
VFTLYYQLMKKTAAIFLLSIFLFNLFGYRLYINYKITATSQSLQTVLDKDEYNQEDLISIKQSINLPYYNNNSSFSRAYGEVEVNGVIYTYVKSRIYNDSVEMLCIPNTTKQQLLQNKNDFATTVFDLQKDENKKASQKTNAFIKLFSEYENVNQLQIDGSLLKASIVNYYFNTSNTEIQFHTTVEQPPDELFFV